ncbi:MAG TPA: tryptophan--tRNA ligase [Streptosporangiaceae bacterium]|nr:tryptophan--tRNA ligase [Streptosporangiaceae bacterium]
MNAKPAVEPAPDSAADAVCDAAADTGLEDRILADPGSFRVLTGDRPTGPLHVGHLFGTLRNRVLLQRRGVELFVLIADYQVLTDRDLATGLGRQVEDLLLDYLAVGIEPAGANAATIFTHSAVGPLNQLMLPFLSLVSVAELQRNPTVKDEIAAAGITSVTGLMLTYPVHQAADILFCRANLVPVGRDQAPHVELTRLIARRFNARHCRGEPLFPEPEVLLGEVPMLPGTDGRKMSKSRGNAITLAATADETATLIRRAQTDSDRFITYAPERRPGVAGLLQLAAACLRRTPEDLADEVGGSGGAGLKMLATEAVNEYLRPIRQRRSQFGADRGELRRILREGNERATAIADQTLTDVRQAMGMAY